MTEELRRHYDVLGLEPGADEKMVKRAYFRLVKQYTPEEHPEEFQAIRAAYEALSHLGEQREQTDVPETMDYKAPQDPTANRHLQIAMALLNKGDAGNALRMAEELAEEYGEYDSFYVLMAQSSLLLGKPGKCVQAFEHLVQLRPKDPEMRRCLAMAYFNRNYMKKALAAFRTAYDMGVREAEFLSTFADCCENRGLEEEFFARIQEAVTAFERSRGENLEDLTDALTKWGRHIIGSTYLRRTYEDAVTRFFEEGLLYFDQDDNEFDFFLLLNDLSEIHLDREDYDLNYLLRCIRFIQPHFTQPDLISEVKEMYDALQLEQLQGDPNCSDAIVQLAAFSTSPGEDGMTAEERSFSQLDVKLRVMEEWPGVVDQLDELERACPGRFNHSRDFIAQLRELEDIEPLRQKMIAEYDRKAKWFSANPFYDEYPQRRPRLETVVWNSAESGVRTVGKKIGRNDPCPCGSGKKYKKCCGRNA